MERNATIQEAFRQYFDGAITFIEFYLKVGSMVTQEDIDEYNQFPGTPKLTLTVKETIYFEGTTHVVACLSRGKIALESHNIREAQKFLGNNEFLRSDGYCIFTRQEWEDGSCDAPFTHKPNIARLFEAFQRFTLNTHRAGINRNKWKEAQEGFRKELKTLGIEELFDWNEEL